MTRKEIRAGDDTEEFFFDEAGLDKIVACARGLLIRPSLKEVCTAYRQKDSSIDTVLEREELNGRFHASLTVQQFDAVSFLLL
jgi:hypothetical protein